MPADTTRDTLHADQVAFWSGEGGDIWLARETRTDAMLAGLGNRALAAAAAQPGEAVLDVGCGTGATSRALARAVTPSGSVLGLDLSIPMMAEASRRAAAEGLANVRFVAGDASAYALTPASIDLLFSRFGVMFFGDPVAAFTHLRRALKPRGRLAFLCWRPFKDNAWAFVPFIAAAPFLPPMPRPGPHDPGPFAFGDRDYVQRILTSAGFSDITIDPIDDQAVFQTSSLDEAAARAAEVGPMTRLLRDAPEAARQQALEAVSKALAPYMAGGAVRLSTACWLVKAINAG